MYANISYVKRKSTTLPPVPVVAVVAIPQAVVVAAVAAIPQAAVAILSKNCKYFFT